MARQPAPLRAWVLAPLAAVLAVVLLTGAVASALRVETTRTLAGLPALGQLDYRSLRGGSVAPLRNAFVDAVLGTRFAAVGPGGVRPQVPVPEALPPSDVAPPRPPLLPDRLVPVPAPVRAEQPFTNDDFRRALTVRSLPFDARTDASTATREQGEPTSCSRTGGTAWYRFTPARDGRLVADTSGTRGPVALGVFTGPDLPRLRQVACGSDATGGAQVVLPVRRGTTYAFQVAGVLGSGRTAFHLSVLPTTSLASPPGGVDGFHQLAAVSGDGRVVAYASGPSPNCVSGDACPTTVGQVTVLDRATGRRELVSVTPQGRGGGGYSFLPSLSHDGRFVGFSSRAADLVPGDTNGTFDYFVRDRRTGTTVRASLDSTGRQGPGTPRSRNFLVHGVLSASGRHAAFSTPDRLDEDDLNLEADVYVRDLRTGRTTLESRGVGDARPLTQSDFPSLSADGRWVAFTTAAPEIDGRRETCTPARDEPRSCFSLVLRDRRHGVTRVVARRLDGAPDVEVVRSVVSADGSTVVWSSTSDRLVRGDSNRVADVFAWSRRGGRLTRVSVSSQGQQQLDATPAVAAADKGFLAAGTRSVAVSADGRHVLFESRAGNLVAADTNGATDVFRHDRLSGTTRRLSLGPDGEQADADSVRPAVSADGQVVAFESDARSLSPRDGEPVTDVYVSAPR